MEVDSEKGLQQANRTIIIQEMIVIMMLIIGLHNCFEFRHLLVYARKNVAI